jgi:DNA-binding LacI/PurR family transcriptional regulator
MQPPRSLPSNAQPKYQRVFDELRQEIDSGKYKPGQKFPSEAALVTRFGASRITVGRAVSDLRRQGLVHRRAGSGTYVREVGSHLASSGLSFGLLIPDLGRTEIFEPICQGMAEAPQASEHALLWGNAQSGDAAATGQDRAWQLCQHYIARKVSGVFFAPLDVAPSESRGPEDRTNRQILAALEQARIPVVLLDRDYLPYPQRSTRDLVGIDNWRTGFLATEHLIHAGCRRIAFLSSAHRSASTVEERAAGYREALFVHGLPVEPALVQRLSAEDHETIGQLMESLKPEAFVCANDLTAGHLMQVLLALGVRIPGDVRIVGMDDVAYASLLPVPLTTMHQPCREIGMAAMALMLERISRPDMPARHVLLDCPLIVRKSCGAAPAPRAAARDSASEVRN